MESWTTAEKFVWNQVCRGEEADLSDWPAQDRALGSRFLETVLFADDYRHALTRKGVRIVNARFEETIELENGELRHKLELEHCLLETGANLKGLKSSQDISFGRSRVLASLDLQDCHVDANLFMDRGGEFDEVNLLNAHVGGQLNLTGSTVNGKLDLDGLHVGTYLLMKDGAKFNTVILSAAHIGVSIVFDNSEVRGALEMPAVEVGRYLFMKNATFHEIILWD